MSFSGNVQIAFAIQSPHNMLPTLCVTYHICNLPHLQGTKCVTYPMYNLPNVYPTTCAAYPMSNLLHVYPTPYVTYPLMMFPGNRPPHEEIAFESFSSDNQMQPIAIVFLHRLHVRGQFTTYFWMTTPENRGLSLPSKR